ncbi:MAG: hypothetical protein RJA36_802 [Pseudomonadota bacterium]|jgi:hypothetical protein
MATTRTQLRRRHKAHKRRNCNRGFRRRHGLPETGSLTMAQIAMALQPTRCRALVDRLTSPIAVGELSFLDARQQQALEIAMLPTTGTEPYTYTAPRTPLPPL